MPITLPRNHIRFKIGEKIRPQLHQNHDLLPGQTVVGFERASYIHLRTFPGRCGRVDWTSCGYECFVARRSAGIHILVLQESSMLQICEKTTVRLKLSLVEMLVLISLALRIYTPITVLLRHIVQPIVSITLKLLLLFIPVRIQYAPRIEENNSQIEIFTLVLQLLIGVSL